MCKYLKATPFGWTHADVTHEDPTEVALIHKATHEGDFRHAVL